MDAKKLDTLSEPLKRAPREVQLIVQRILIAEADQLYRERPRLSEDIVEIVKSEVK